MKLRKLQEIHDFVGCSTILQFSAVFVTVFVYLYVPKAKNCIAVFCRILQDFAGNCIFLQFVLVFCSFCYRKLQCMFLQFGARCMP